jgi:hypothetical protein
MRTIVLPAARGTAGPFPGGADPAVSSVFIPIALDLRCSAQPPSRKEPKKVSAASADRRSPITVAW